MTMHSQWEDITPSRARTDLVTANCGRPVSASLVEKYARDMENSRWHDSPEGPIYDTHKILRDAQHRYLAVIKASQALLERGVIEAEDEFSVRMWVTRDAPEDVFPFLNIGLNRTAANQLYIAGYGNSATTLAAICRRVVMWEAGHPTGYAYRPTRAEILEVLMPVEASPARTARILEAAEYARTWKMYDISPATAGFLYWVVTGRNHDEGLDFMEKVRTGADIGKAHPVTLLRKRLGDDKRNALKRGSQVKSEMVIWLTIRAWNAVRLDEKITKLQVPEKLSDKTFIRPR
jgi:hypothetical protein